MSRQVLEWDGPKTINSTTIRPLKRRSKSLPVYPPPEPTMTLTQTGECVFGDSPPDLPSDPYIWTPLHVSLYLSYYLRRYPIRIIHDLSRYIREEARLSGRRLLRLTEFDLEEMGMTAKWRKLVMTAVKKVRAERLKGRIWGFGGGGWMGDEDHHDPNKTLTRKDARRASAAARLSAVSEEDETDLSEVFADDDSILQYDALPLDAVSTCGTDSSVPSSPCHSTDPSFDEALEDPQTPGTEFADEQCDPHKGQESLSQYFVPPPIMPAVTFKDLEEWRKDILQEVKMILVQERLDRASEEKEKAKAMQAQKKASIEENPAASSAMTEDEWQQLFSPIWKGVLLVAVGAGLKVLDKYVIGRK